ncbi:Cytochrome d ubiquinol oxidase subunit 2 [Candidatus Cyrtobacter comes]|uniref:Cytochrome d ubiquinol oxidase subunit 2 n=1 Tax=Candidatus Cyrtobacter comes TaxID=675776 RepID=A0ABU5L6W7_9RICK|nr:cytochrome d ubiquinol oxidase subunit II [Candidatus Cyrtobacter comes]MDZ5761864.1 Cytochrome d ubiquinol oxidase subunit 2 [Candidatus Cyrtobacter comes]
MDYFLPLIFAILLGVAVLVYVILDGYDLGVGILVGLNKKQKHRDLMVLSIGPFWDANETWLVLAVGIVLVAFPFAQGYIMAQLYLPTFVMIIGLIFRGVAFDFRVKVHSAYKKTWDIVFSLGSLLTSAAQGYMLGKYIMAFEESYVSYAFSILIALLLPIGYSLLGSCWLILKMEGDLFKESVALCRKLLLVVLICMIMVSIITPLVSEYVYRSWFSSHGFFLFLPMLVLSALAMLYLRKFLLKIEDFGGKLHELPIIVAALIFFLCFNGAAWNFFPYMVPGKWTIWEVAASTESLTATFIGVVIVLPFLLGYTVFAYRVFRGKTSKEMSY